MGGQLSRHTLELIGKLVRLELDDRLAVEPVSPLLADAMARLEEIDDAVVEKQYATSH